MAAAYRKTGEQLRSELWRYEAGKSGLKVHLLLDSLDPESGFAFAPDDSQTLVSDTARLPLNIPSRLSRPFTSSNSLGELDYWRFELSDQQCVFFRQYPGEQAIEATPDRLIGAFCEAPGKSLSVQAVERVFSYLALAETAVARAPREPEPVPATQAEPATVAQPERLARPEPQAEPEPEVAKAIPQREAQPVPQEQPETSSESQAASAIPPASNTPAQPEAAPKAIEVEQAKAPKPNEPEEAPASKPPLHKRVFSTLKGALDAVTPDFKSLGESLSDSASSTTQDEDAEASEDIGR